MNKRMRSFACLAVLAGVVTGCQVFFPLVPNRISRLFGDAGAGAVGRGEFSAIQIDPASEDSAGPQLVATGDLDGDGLLDVATAWNESKPIQIHFQRRVGGATTFETITLAGDFPITIVAGLEIADMDGDGINDVVALIKENGVFARCRLSGEILNEQDVPAGVILIYYGPTECVGAADGVGDCEDAADGTIRREIATNALAWLEVPLSQSETAGAPPAIPETPETGGFTSMAIAQIDGLNGPEIVVAWNANDCEGGGNRVEYYVNPGQATARQSNAWAPVTVLSDAPSVKWVDVADLDRDGDFDIVATYPDARGQNLRWLRNPTIDIPDPFHLSDGNWQLGAIGQLATEADIFDMGDIDGDGIVDIVVRSSLGRVIVWFRGPPNPTTQPIRNIPWQVFTIAEFNERTPEAVVLADIDGDAQLEIVASAGGAVVWLDPFALSSVFTQWEENLIIDDVRPVPAVTDPNVDQNEVSTQSTIINELVVVDLDGDGGMDVIATMDRRDQSGVTNDAIVWFRAETAP